VTEPTPFVSSPAAGPFEPAGLEDVLRLHGLVPVGGSYSLTQHEMRTFFASIAHQATRAPLASLYEARTLLDQVASAVRFTSPLEARQWLKEAMGFTAQRCTRDPSPSTAGPAPALKDHGATGDAMGSLEQNEPAPSAYTLKDFIREAGASGKSPNRILEMLARLPPIVCDFGSPIACAQPQPAAPKSPIEPSIYIASRVHHGPALRVLRDLYPIKANWIDATIPCDAADHVRRWTHLPNEIRACTAFVLYADENDIQIGSEFIEVGMALAFGRQVFVAAPGAQPDLFSMQPLGAWSLHPLVTVFTEPGAMTQALQAAQAHDPTAAGDCSALVEVDRSRRDCSEAYHVTGTGRIDCTTPCSREDIPRASDTPSAASVGRPPEASRLRLLPGTPQSEP